MNNIMVHHSINYKPGFYAGNKPYRDCLIAALKHFGLTKFQRGSEFWTLGGKEWYEYRFLLEQGLKFGKNSYHNVDYGDIDSLDDPAVVSHKLDFFDIWQVWKKPKIICFDSTNGLVDNNQSIWVDLVQLGIAAAEIANKVSLNWNFLSGYGNILYDRSDEKNDYDKLFDRYEQWLTILVDHAAVVGFSVDFFNECVLAPKEGSNTAMLSGHCLISSS